MIINDLGSTNSLITHFVNELRDREIQKNSLCFRNNLVRLGEIFAYEISKTLEYEPTTVITDLGEKSSFKFKRKPLLATVLRAGIPLHMGLLNYFDSSDSAFVSAYRQHAANEDITINVEYVSCPKFSDTVLILSDTMLATGKSLVQSYKSILESGTPYYTHFVAVLASTEGIDYLKKAMYKKKCTLWVAAIDDELTAQGYIVPGLGDAGDLAFGNKF
ncbi:MAG: uracil phosphoribosyltransferase [Lentimicrobiaceae bacterium]|nr:uracil phosphoribosyltransferase [Lentimicrobiaceae bacterium]